MRKIILICTQHGENGICTSLELCKIFERVKPEIIFEEIPPSLFDQYYNDKSRSNLESDAINMYLEKTRIEHIPVDVYDIPENFFEENKYLHKRVEASSRDYRHLIDSNFQYVRDYGFRYLNSFYCVDINSEIDNSIEAVLKQINDDKLNRIYSTWKNVIKKREN